MIMYISLEISALESCSISEGICAEVSELKYICGLLVQGSVYYTTWYVPVFVSGWFNFNVFASETLSLHFKRSFAFAQESSSMCELQENCTCAS